MAAIRTTPTEPAVPVEPPVVAAARVLVSAAADLVTGVQRAVVGSGNVRTARDNAWDAMLADRARNEARAELTREVAALVAAGRHPAAKRPRTRALAKTS